MWTRLRLKLDGANFGKWSARRARPCPADARGKKVSLFIFFCRLRSLVCRSHDLRHFRFPATQRFPPSQCLSHDDSAHAIFIRRYNGLHCCYTRTASIADFDTRKDAWFDSQTRRWTHLRELNRSTKRLETVLNFGWISTEQFHEASTRRFASPIL